MEEPAKQNLETLLEQSGEGSAIVISPTEIIGNRAGYLSLALAALEASQGNTINLRKQDWCTVVDWDSCIDELKYDEEAAPPEPPKPPWGSGAIGNLVGKALVLGLLIVFALGLYEIVHIVLRLILMK